MILSLLRAAFLQARMIQRTGEEELAWDTLAEEEGRLQVVMKTCCQPWLLQIRFELTVMKAGRAIIMN